jgi:hypothetical protein
MDKAGVEVNHGLNASLQNCPQERFGDSPAGITFQDQPAGTQ